MAAEILIAYATRYGSTAEVADRMGARLRQQGHEVEVRQAREVRSLDGNRAVVLGAPFYIGSMLKDARGFLDAHRKQLERLPVAVFALGPISSSDDLAEAKQQLEGALAKLGWLKPAAAEMFVGSYDPARLRMADKLIAKVPVSPLYGKPARDDRDWDAIRAWVDGLPEALGLRAGEPGGPGEVER